jgi:outer membrane lipoprotein-sorting protein
MDMGMTMYMKKPSFRLEQNMMGQDMIMVFDGTNGWMKSPQGTQELTPEQLEQMKAQSDVNSMNLYAFKEKGYTIEKVGKEKIDGVTVFNLKITDKEGKVSNLYIDAEKYLAVKLTSDTEAGNAEILFVDYKKFDCILMPSKMTIKAGGMEMAMKIEDYKCNPKIDDSKFKKPE